MSRTIENHHPLPGGSHIVTVWCVVYVDGEAISMKCRAGSIGVGMARESNMELSADIKRAAYLSARVEATAKANRALARIVNKYRRGKHITTKQEEEKKSAKERSDYFNKKMKKPETAQASLF